MLNEDGFCWITHTHSCQGLGPYREFYFTFKRFQYKEREQSELPSQCGKGTVRPSRCIKPDFSYCQTWGRFLGGS